MKQFFTTLMALGLLAVAPLPANAIGGGFGTAFEALADKPLSQITSITAGSQIFTEAALLLAINQTEKKLWVGNAANICRGYQVDNVVFDTVGGKLRITGHTMIAAGNTTYLTYLNVVVENTMPAVATIEARDALSSRVDTKVLTGR